MENFSIFLILHCHFDIWFFHFYFKTCNSTFHNLSISKTKSSDPLLPSSSGGWHAEELLCWFCLASLILQRFFFRQFLSEEYSALLPSTGHITSPFSNSSPPQLSFFSGLKCTSGEEYPPALIIWNTQRTKIKKKPLNIKLQVRKKLRRLERCWTKDK